MSHANSKYRRLLVGLGAIIPLLAPAVSCSRGGGAETSRAVAELPTVAVVKAARADLSSHLVLTAEFEPFQEIDVMAKVSGYIREINVDIGRPRSRRTTARDARDT